jgi:hypothetical protein
VQLIAVAGAIATGRSALVAGVAARCAVRQYVVLVASSETIAACFCANIIVGVLAGRTVGLGNVQLIACSETIATGYGTFVTLVRTRRAVGGRYVQLIAVAGAVATGCGTLVARVFARSAVGQDVVLIAVSFTVATGVRAFISVGVGTRCAVWLWDAHSESVRAGLAHICDALVIARAQVEL